MTQIRSDLSMLIHHCYSAYRAILLCYEVEFLPSRSELGTKGVVGGMFEMLHPTMEWKKKLALGCCNPPDTATFSFLYQIRTPNRFQFSFTNGFYYNFKSKVQSMQNLNNNNKILQVCHPALITHRSMF